MSDYRAIIFVDLIDRDLMGDALIAHELEKRGVTCYLEPLETWQAAIHAYKPHLVLYNHLTVRHLANFSQDMKKWGVLVGCLMNEGLLYSDSARMFSSKRQHNHMHCDLYLTWNTIHRDELIKQNFCTPPESASTIGCPRFDYYKEPWCQVYQQPRNNDGLPVILVNGTSALAHLYTMPRENADKFFEPWMDKIEGVKDYWGLVEAHYKNRVGTPAYIDPLIRSGKYRIIIRPHPREELAFYEQWFETLTEEERSRVSLSINEPPPVAIFKSDVVLNCEDCTTSMEAWLAGKPTITLALEQHPYWFTETYKRLSPIAYEAEQVDEMIGLALKNPDQPDYAPIRQEHLEKWLYSTDGRCAKRAAEQIANIIKEKNLTPSIPFSLRGFWKKWKLLILKAFNEPYTARPKHILRRLFSSKHEQVSIRYRDYLKGVRRSGAEEAMQTLAAVEAAWKEKNNPTDR
jgi:surface carbohydrate biosynthesis protein